jgi:hypothetical protein
VGRILPVVVVALVIIYCVVEVAQSDPQRVRLLPRWLWATLIIGLPGIGAIGWLLLGRPVSSRATPPRGRPKAPDDDPDFLRGL